MQLLSPITLSDLELSNRVVMAPMTRQRASADGVPTDIMVEYYRQRSTAGLIITEATPVSPAAIGYMNVPGIYTGAQIAGWKKVTQAVHAESGKIFLQLWHVGRVSHPLFQPNGEAPIAPSAIAIDKDVTCYSPEGPTTYPVPRAMTSEDIQSVRDQFVAAAKNAIDAGFDGVEIHGANGYLLDQFLRDKTNKRDDAYGGSIENRCRLLLEVISDVSGAIGSARTGVRISPVNPYNDIADSNPVELFSYLVNQFNLLSPVYVHVAEGAIGTDDPVTEFDYRELRNRFAGIYIANGGYERENAELSIAENHADLIAFGRPFISNPDYVKRLALNSELNEVDYSTCYSGDAEGYTDYSALD